MFGHLRSDTQVGFLAVPPNFLPGRPPARFRGRRFGDQSEMLAFPGSRILDPVDHSDQQMPFTRGGGTRQSPAKLLPAGKPMQGAARLRMCEIPALCSPE